jgi:hypothetical protein
MYCSFLVVLLGPSLLCFYAISPVSSFTFRRYPPYLVSSKRAGLSTLSAQEKDDVTGLSSSRSVGIASSINYQINEFFKRPVPDVVKSYLMVRTAPAVKRSRLSNDDKGVATAAAAAATSKDTAGAATRDDEDLKTWITAPPQSPGRPRPLWLVIAASIPTGLVWYGYYKFCVEEELLQYEMDKGKVPRGFGGYGTLGPFCYGLLLGPLAAAAQWPGGLNWSGVGIVFIYYTQFLLYDRVNEMIREEGVILDEPLPLWWTLPIFFPFNLIVGLRQVHFLADYHYRQRGVAVPPKDPVVSFFPFIGADRFSWQQFVTTPSLWCSLLLNVDPIDVTRLPEPLRTILQPPSKVNDS